MAATAATAAEQAMPHTRYPTTLGHPRPLWMLFMTEFWERFCYYGMRWALSLYVVAAFFGGDPAAQAAANRTYGAFTALVYATGILGGYVADKLLGFQRSVLIGAAFIAAGLFTLLVHDHTTFLVGLALIIVGNGLFKPNISSMVGGLYAEGDARRDRGFTIFYMGINAGAFFSPLVTGWAANELFGGTPEHPNYAVVFAAAGVGMVVGLLWFGFGRKLLLGVGAPPERRKGVGPLAAVLVGGLLLVPVLYLLLNKSDILDYILWALLLACCAMLLAAGFKADKVQLDKIVAMLILFVANILFWMFFEQAGSSFSFLADQLVNRKIGNWEVPIGWFQSVNPAAIVLLAPVITILWTFLDRKNTEPSIPRKFGFGLIWNALGFFVVFWALRSMVDATDHIPLWPLALCYLLQTIGELCLSPIGLSMVTKLAPPHMVGATMGAWFMSVALGNKMAGNLAARISGESGMTIASALKGFSFSFWLLIAAGVVVLAISPRINRLMHGVK
jgi:POT family proton-dependent oligopeptide transporter